MTILKDNQGAISSPENESINQRNKHVDVKYHFLRDYVAAGRVVFKYCPEEKMVADALT